MGDELGWHNPLILTIDPNFQRDIQVHLPQEIKKAMDSTIVPLIRDGGFQRIPTLKRG